MSAVSTNPLLRAAYKAGVEASQEQGLPIRSKLDQTKYWHVYNYYERQICAACCVKYEGRYNGEKKWFIGECCWCKKKTNVIDARHCGWIEGYLKSLPDNYETNQLKGLFANETEQTTTSQDTTEAEDAITSKENPFLQFNA